MLIAMDPLTLFGVVSVSTMLACYALEDRSPWFVLGFAVSFLKLELEAVAIISRRFDFRLAGLPHLFPEVFSGFGNVNLSFGWNRWGGKGSCRPCCCDHLFFLLEFPVSLKDSENG